MNLVSVLWISMVGGALLTLAVEFAYPKSPTPLRERIVHLGRNALLFVISTVFLSVVVGGALAEINRLGEARQVGLLYALHAPTWLAAIIGFAAADFADYVFHRASHKNRVLWLLHAVHHSDPQLDVSTSLRQHPFSQVVAFALRAAVILALGAPAWALLLRDICGVINSHLHHGAINWSPRWIAWMEKNLAWFLIVPTAHWFHHHPDAANANSNYGQVLSCWDRLFGTYRGSESPPHESGLRALADERWQSVWGMLLTPWRARRIRDF